MDTSAPLPVTSYIILGMLSFQERSGYELKQVLDKSIRYFYMSPAQSQIYAELRRLQSCGFVEERKVVQEQRPDKRVYRITEPGLSAVQEWFSASKVTPDGYKSPFQLRLFFGHLLSETDLKSLIGNHRLWLADVIMQLEEQEEALKTRMAASEQNRNLIYPLMVIQLKLAGWRGELAWTDQATEQLNQARPTEESS